MKEKAFYALSLNLLFWTAQFQLNLNRSPAEVALAFLGSILTAFFLFIYQHFNKRKSFSIILTSLWIPPALLMVIHLTHPWMYFLSCALAVLCAFSKKQNSIAFAVMFCLCGWPDSIAKIYAESFSLQTGFIFMASAFGIVAVVKSEKWILCLSYLLTLTFGSIIIGSIVNEPISYFWASTLNGLGILFLAFFLTESNSTSSGTTSQIGFGACVAVLSIFLQIKEIYFGEYFALLMTGLIFSITKNLRTGKFQSRFG